VLRTDLPDYRRSSEPELLAALRAKDALALAETCHRTLAAAHGSARRLLSGTGTVEALLRTVYVELWTDPPSEVLERWVRRRAFDLAREDLVERGAAPAAPSVTVLLPELPAPEPRYLESAERILADLDQGARLAVVRAHDAGVPSAEQPDPDATAALERGLVALAGPGENDPTEAPGGSPAGLADWVLGLADPATGDSVEEAVAADPAIGAWVRVLRRGRRRLEGLPPTPDLAQRVLATALAGMPAAPPAAAPAPSGPPAARSWGGPVAASALDEPDDAEAPERPAPPEPAPAPGPGPEPEPEPTPEPAEGEPPRQDLRLPDLLREDEAADLPPADRDEEPEPEGPTESWESILGGEPDTVTEARTIPGEALAGPEPAPLPPRPGGFVTGPQPAPARRSFGRKLLRALLMLLILAAGAAIGLYLVTQVFMPTG
jgi:hypothetical protein